MSFYVLCFYLFTKTEQTNQRSCLEFLRILSLFNNNTIYYNVTGHKTNKESLVEMTDIVLTLFFIFDDSAEGFQSEVPV